MAVAFFAGFFLGLWVCGIAYKCYIHDLQYRHDQTCRMLRDHYQSEVDQVVSQIERELSSDDGDWWKEGRDPPW